MAKSRTPVGPMNTTMFSCRYRASLGQAPSARPLPVHHREDRAEPVVRPSEAFSSNSAGGCSQGAAADPPDELTCPFTAVSHPLLAAWKWPVCICSSALESL